MLLLRIGLYAAVLLAVSATWMSTSAGYPVEVAMLRGLVVFMGVSFVAYLGELVVATAPPPRRPRRVEAADSHDGADDENEAINLPAVRAERSAAADQRRAA